MILREGTLFSSAVLYGIEYFYTPDKTPILYIFRRVYEYLSTMPAETALYARVSTADQNLAGQKGIIVRQVIYR